jgi:hypothetical protein
MRESRRELAIVVIGLAALTVAATAGAARSRPAPSPKPLWQAFPLGERPARATRPTRPATRSAPPVPRSAPTGPREPVAPASSASDESHTLTFGLAAALVAVASACLALSLRRAPSGSRWMRRDRNRASPLGIWFLISVPAGAVLGWLAVHYPP